MKLRRKLGPLGPQVIEELKRSLKNVPGTTDSNINAMHLQAPVPMWVILWLLEEMTPQPETQKSDQ